MPEPFVLINAFEVPADADEEFVRGGPQPATSSRPSRATSKRRSTAPSRHKPTSASSTSPAGLTRPLPASHPQQRLPREGEGARPVPVAPRPVPDRTRVTAPDSSRRRLGRSLSKVRRSRHSTRPTAQPACLSLGTSCARLNTLRALVRLQRRPQNLSPHSLLTSTLVRSEAPTAQPSHTSVRLPRSLSGASLLHREVFVGVVFDNKNRPFAGSLSFQKSPLTDSNRRPPPYHGEFALRLCDLGKALGSALSLQSGWFLRSVPLALNDPEPPRGAPNLSPEPSPREARICCRPRQPRRPSPRSPSHSTLWCAIGYQASAERGSCVVTGRRG